MYFSKRFSEIFHISLAILSICNIGIYCCKKYYTPFYEANHISYIRLHNYNVSHQNMFLTEVLELETIYIL
jgi:hypothetical protein